MCCLRLLCKSLSAAGSLNLQRNPCCRKSGALHRLRTLCKRMPRRDYHSMYRTGGSGMSACQINLKRKNWYDFLWIATTLYLTAGFFNILFAWAGLLCFFIPLIIAIAGGGKAYCNRYCGRGQLLALLGKKLSPKRNPPAFLHSPWFRYGFLIFFFAMFFQMLWNTYLVFSGAHSLRMVVKLLWTFKLPWQWAYHATGVSPWIAQFSFGFYSVMLTSTILGIITMLLFKPRSWCVYCPMGTMTQLICIIKK